MRRGTPGRLAPLLILAIGFVALSGAAAEAVANYDQVRSDRWRCRLCPFELASHREGSWRVGAISVEDAEPRFGRDNGLDKEGTRLDLHAGYRHRGTDGRAVTVRGDDLGLDSRDLVLDYADSRRGGIAFRWREIPRNVATDGRTPYAGRTVLSLPEHWVRAFDTARMTALGDTARMTALGDTGNAFDHGTQRRMAAATANFRPHPRWRIEADYSRETRTGTADTHADFLYQTVGLPKPIDHETEELGGKVRFEAGTFLLAGSVRGSRFENGDPALEWDNAFGTLPATGRKGLAPSNDARSASLVSRWTRGRTSINGSVTWGRHRQDAPFLPYSGNPGVDVGPPPSDSLHGQARTLATTFAVVSRPTDRLRVSLRHRRSERDNDTRTLLLTPVAWRPVRNDAAPQPRVRLRSDAHRVALRLPPLAAHEAPVGLGGLPRPPGSRGDRTQRRSQKLGRAPGDGSPRVPTGGPVRGREPQRLRVPRRDGQQSAHAPLSSGRARAALPGRSRWTIAFPPRACPSGSTPTTDGTTIRTRPSACVATRIAAGAPT